MPKNATVNIRGHRKTKHVRILENISYLGDIQTDTKIELIQYDHEKFSAKPLASPDNLKKLIDPKKTNWIKVVGISDAQKIYDICKIFGIQRFDLKDMLSANRITKVIPYSEATFILMSGYALNAAGEPHFNQIAFIVGKDFVVSFQETTEPIFDDVKEAICDSRVLLREKSADYLLCILLNDVLSTYSETLMLLLDKVGEREEELIDNNRNETSTMRFIQQNKKEYMLIKRSVTALREEYVNLLHNTNGLIDKSNILYFNDFDDRLRTSLDDLEMFYQAVGSLSDLYFNNHNLQMNNVIKKLTIVSTIFMPLTFIVGVWGMNFEFMPELQWAHGYLFAWGVFALMVGCSLLFLKHKKWF
ncbi:magnesium transport protein CorA [Bacteroidia bacterium]|nr:magnesium transport protein CorA [Bacteroidia bacterium]